MIVGTFANYFLRQMIDYLKETREIIQFVWQCLSMEEYLTKHGELKILQSNPVVVCW